MLPIAHMYDAIIRAKAVCMNGRSQINFAPNNGLNTALFAVRDDLSIDPAVALLNAEDDGLASCSASTLATHTTRAEVRFVQLDITGERRLSLAMLSDGLANQSQITIDGIAVQSSHGSDLSGRQIKRKELEQLPKFSMRNSCADKLLGTNCHDLV